RKRTGKRSGRNGSRVGLAQSRRIAHNYWRPGSYTAHSASSVRMRFKARVVPQAVQTNSATSPIASLSARSFARIKSLVAARVIMPFLFVPEVRCICSNDLGDEDGRD